MLTCLLIRLGSILGLEQLQMRVTYATFTDPEMAEKAAGALMDHGLRQEHFSIVFPPGFRNHMKLGAEESEIDAEDRARGGLTTTTAGDALAGAGEGAGIGLLTGALAALVAVFVPGVGLVLGGGALAIALGGMAGATAAGAAAGGMAGWLKDQGVPPSDTEHHARVLTAGGAMIAVTLTDDMINMADVESILVKYEGSVSEYPPAAALAGLPLGISVDRP